MKTTFLGAVLLIGLAAAAQAAPITYTYPGIGGVEQITLTNSDPFAWTDLTLTETLTDSPSVTDSVSLPDLTPGASLYSGIIFALPSQFGADPESIYGPSPFDVTLSYTENGAQYAAAWQQTYDATGAALPVTAPVPTVVTPEPSALLVLGFGFGLLALAARRRA